MRFTKRSGGTYAYVLNRPTMFVDPFGLKYCYRWHQSGQVTCLPDPQPLCVIQGWCDEVPDPQANPNCYLDCITASNPPWVSHVSNVSTVHAAATQAFKRLAGGTAAAVASVGLATYQLTLPASCKLICAVDACSSW
jgi:hypothetical protein